MSYSYVVDTNIWIDFFKYDRFRDELTANRIETPCIVLVELAGYFSKHKVSDAYAGACFADIEAKSAIGILDLERSVRAAKIKKELNLPTVDAIIYSYVEKGKILLTQDADMKNLPGVDYREK